MFATAPLELQYQLKTETFSKYNNLFGIIWQKKKNEKFLNLTKLRQKLANLVEKNFACVKNSSSQSTVIQVRNPIPRYRTNTQPHANNKPQLTITNQY
jgi:hypothetical protein